MKTRNAQPWKASSQPPRQEYAAAADGNAKMSEDDASVTSTRTHLASCFLSRPCARNDLAIGSDCDNMRYQAETQSARRRMGEI